MASEIQITMLVVCITESNFVTKPAKLAARAGPNHRGARAVPSACQPLSSVKLAYQHQYVQL